jgi:hypothetical protein
MSHSTPATYLVWSLLSVLLGIFLIYHLWCFDRFRCLKWHQGTQGAFKRVMIYSYLLSVPLIMTYSVGFCVIKYREGFIVYPGHGVIPNPYQLWSPRHRSAITPLYLCLAVSWSLEMVTHLEELCFWLFVVKAGPTQRDWFSSLYFKMWMIGSGIAILYMPFVTIFTRDDPLKCEAYTFLAGSLGSLSITLWFLPVLHLFTPFLSGLRRDGADMNTIIRLTKFHELNSIRIVFRLLFAVPLCLLSIDGIRPHPHVNESVFASEFLSMLAGFSVIVSSGITLVIFFPRSIETEIAAHDAGARTRGIFSSRHHLTLISQEQELCGTYVYDPEDTPVDSDAASPSSLYNKPTSFPSSLSPSREDILVPAYSPQQSPILPPPTAQPLPTEPIRLTPNRRRPSLDLPPPTRKSQQQQQQQQQPASDFAERFNNPATSVSRLAKQSFRPSIGTWSPAVARVLPTLPPHPRQFFL